jgi:hypothetical protein
MILPSQWSQYYTTLDSLPYRLYDPISLFSIRPFLQPILDDMHTRIVVKKSRQLGMTETALRKLLYMNCNFNIISAYVIPLMKKVEEVSGLRIKKVIDSLSPEISKSVKGFPWKDNLKNFKVMTGGNSTLLVQNALFQYGESTPLDFLILDEFDRIDYKTIKAFRSAMASSPLGAELSISTPTFRNVGVDKDYQLSDQREWMIKCSHCSYWQIISWKDNIRQVKGEANLLEKIRFIHKDIEAGSFIRICQKCNKLLNLAECKGIYVAIYPEKKEIRGYHVTQLSAAWINIDKIVSSLRDSDLLREWYNYELGEIYEGDDSLIKITKEEIKRLVNPHISGNDLQKIRELYAIKAVGIDWGNINWYLVLGVPKSNLDELHVIYMNFYESNLMDSIQEPALQAIKLAKAIQADIIVADAGYGADRNPIILEKWDRDFFTCEYYGDTEKERKSSNIEPSFETRFTQNKLPRVRVYRPANVKKLLMTLRKGFIKFNNFSGNTLLDTVWDLFQEHVINICVEEGKREDKKNIGASIEYKDEVIVSGPDHYFHALLYSLIGINYCKTSGGVIEIDIGSGLREMKEPIITKESYNKIEEDTIIKIG